MLNAYPEAITSQEISDQTGIELNKIKCALRRYSDPKYSFIGKLKGKTAEGYRPSTFSKRLNGVLQKKMD